VYTITATNSGGSDTTTITIVVNDALPIITYSPTSYTLTKGVAMTVSTPTVNGGAVVTWSVSPSLPAGLTFETSNGTIWGTPTSITSSASYTVSATNTGGTETVVLTIVVNDAAPADLDYTPNTFTLTKGTQMTSVSPTSNGGTVVSYSVSPSLPAGLTFETSNGTIWGTPTAVTSSASYTITATNTGGTDTASVTIVVNDIAPSIAYSTTSFTLTKGTAMTTTSVTSTGGTVVSYSVSPSLPAGLSLNASTGTLSGTPTAVTSSASYTITATNTGGTDTASVTITVNDIAPSIAYSTTSFTLTKGTAMTTETVTSTGGTVVSYSVSPSLPAGLSLDTSTGAISGTPTAVTSNASYTITATNTGGTDTASVTIVVNDIAPSISYGTTSYTLTKGTAMTTATVTSTGGNVVSYSVSPSLPAGLSLDTSTGAISGTPTAVTSSASYTITANNTGGTDTASVTIVVNDVAPSISYGSTSLTLTNGTAMTTETVTSTGGTVVS
jgi:hypothetical protein